MYVSFGVRDELGIKLGDREVCENGMRKGVLSEYGVGS